MARERVRWLSGANDRRAEELATHILDGLAATARAAGGKPALAYLPVLAETLDTSPGAAEVPPRWSRR
jgi:hypothetical protein